MKPFYLEKRGRIFYIVMNDTSTGLKMFTKSSGKTTEHEAFQVAIAWCKHGIPQTKPGQKTESYALSESALLAAIERSAITVGTANRIVELLKRRGLLESTKHSNKPFATSLLAFYANDSEYVKDRALHGRKLTLQYLRKARAQIQKHYEPYFSDTLIDAVNREQMKAFQSHVCGIGLVADTVTRILSFAKTFFSWMKAEGKLLINPCEKLSNYASTKRERGVLSDTEVTQLFNAAWIDERTCIGNLLASQTGLRVGEIVALKKEDVGIDRLYIKHAWNDVDGLKTPKNGETRITPLLPDTRVKLLSLVDKNPHNDGFIFYSDKPDKPMGSSGFLYALRQALTQIGISLEQQKNRNLCFHSWRHYYAAKMADKVEVRSLQLATGHKSQAMTEHYAAHANEKHFQAVYDATKEQFT